MISYDNYINRIQKVAKFKNFVVKYKFLFIAILAVIIAGTTALLTTKGMVISDIALPEKIAYGESYNPTPASAFLSDVSYEYSVDGVDEWTEEKPVKAGKYLARAVTKKVIGNGYGKAVGFEILPATISFEFTNSESATLVYGDAPASRDYSLTGLVTAYGDRIEGVDFDYDYPEENAEDYTVGVTLKNIRIVDRSGNDSSGCYVYEAAETSYKFAAKPVTFKLADASDTYNGKGFTYDGKADAASLNNLVGSDRYSFATKLTDGSGATVTPLNADSYYIELNGGLKVLDENGKDITYRYDFLSETHGIFTVNRRPVTFLSETKEWTYDGGVHSYAEYSPTSGTVADGQRVTATSLAYVTNVSDGTVRNELSYEIYDASGLPVTANYVITKNTGTIRIIPRPLTITTEGGEWEYDGNTHKVEKHTADGLADGQNLLNISYTGVTNVSDSGKNVLYFDIYSGGVPVNVSNYNITENWGSLTVTPRPLKAETASDEKTYDGYALTNGTVTVTYGGEDADEPAFIYYYESLIKGTLPSIINVGTKENAISLTVPNGNYYIKETVNGTLTVTAREITVSLSDASCEYGEELPAPAVTIGGEGLAVGDGFNGAFLYNGAKASLLGTGTYTISLDKDNCTFTYSNSEKVTEPNYIIKSANTSTLSVGKCTITVNLNDMSDVVYGDEITYVGGYKSLSVEPASGQRVVVDASKVSVPTGLPDADKDYVITCTADAISILSGTTPVTGNYTVLIGDGVLHVNRREITVKALDMTKYYGETINETTYSVYTGNYANEPDLADNETLTIQRVIYNFYSGAIPTAGGNYTITPDVNNIEILKADGTSSRSNYTVTAEAGKLTVNKRPVTIKTPSQTFTYNGAAQYNDGATVAINSAQDFDILTGHEIAVTYKTYITDVAEGEVENVLTCEIHDASGNVSSNYDIGYENGTLKVAPVTINVTLNSYSATYGDDYDYETGVGKYESAPGLITAVDALNIKEVSYSFGTLQYPDATEEGDYYSVSCTDFAITKIAGGADSSDNYTVVWTDGKLTIDKRETTVTLNSFTETYGNTVNYPYGNEEASNKLTGHTVRIDEGSINYSPEETFPDAGDYEITCTIANVHIFGGATDVTQNYTVTEVIGGKLTIDKRAITVTLNDIADVTYGEEVVYENEGETITNAIGVCTVEISSENLQYNPKTVAATYSYPDAGDYNITCSSGDITVISGGKNVSGNYSVTVIDGSLTITAREITVKAKSYSVTYGDGYKYLDCVGSDYGNYANEPDLADGEKLKITSVTFGCGSQPSVGAYGITPTAVTITKADGTDGTQNYTVEYEDGTLTVTQKEVKVELTTFSQSYGEDEHSGKTYAELYSKHIGKVTVTDDEAVMLTFGFTDENGDPVDPKNAGTYGVVILDGETDNYKIIPTGEGKLQIRRRQFHPVLFDKSEVYGATEFTYQSGPSNYEEGFKDYYYCLPAYGEEIEIFVDYDLKGQTLPAVGFYNAVFTGVRVHYADGSYEDSAASDSTLFETANYQIFVYDFQLENKLEITPREITVTLNDMEEGYFYGEEITYAGGGETAEGLLTEFNHYLEIDPEQVRFAGKNGTDYPNAGEYSVTAGEDCIKIYDGDGEEVTKNYNVAEVIGSTLTISARKITVTLQDYEEAVIYGEDVPAPVILTFGYGDLVDGLVYEDKISVTSYVYINEDGEEVTRLDAGSYKLYLGEYSFVDKKGNALPDGNYEIIGDITPANLEISKRPVTVTLKDITRVYGDKNSTSFTFDSNKVEITNDILEISGEYGLASDETLYFLYLRTIKNSDGTRPTMKDVGSYSVEIYAFIVRRADKSYDYIIRPNSSALTNYVVSADSKLTATVTITPKDLTVNLGDISADYGEDPFADYSFETAEGLKFSETLSISKIFALKDGVTVEAQYPDAGNYTLGANDYDAVIYDMDGAEIEDGYKNYNITFTGDLTVNKRQVTVTLNDMPDVVYGEEFKYVSDGTETAEGLLTELGHKLEIDPEGVSFVSKNGTVFPNAGEYTISSDGSFIKIYSENEDGGKTYVNSENYEIKVENGTLTVNARKITVTLQDYEEAIVYGEEVPVPVILTFGYGELGDGLVYEDKISVTSYVNINEDGEEVTHLDAGSYKLYLGEYSFVDKKGNALPEGNYEIIGEITPANLEISKRPVTVTLKDITIEYGKFNNGTLGWNGISTSILSKNLNDYLTVDGLATDERVYAVQWYVGDFTYPVPPVDVKNVGNYLLQLGAIGTKYPDGENSVLYYSDTVNVYNDENYEVTVLNTATLTITPKDVEIPVGEITVTYGEKDNALDGYTYTTEEDFLPFGETIKLPCVNIVGWENYPYGLDADYRLNVGTYPLDPDYNKNNFETYDKDGEYYDGFDNYVVTVKGTLKVNPKTINIELLDFYDIQSKYFYGDGEKLVYPEYKGNYISDDELAYGQQLQVAISWLYNGEPVTSPKNAGTYEYLINTSDSIICDEDGNEVENGIGNYSFVYAEGSSNTVIINPIVVEMTLPDFDYGYYYGDALPYEPYEFVVDHNFDSVVAYEEESLYIAMVYYDYNEYAYGREVEVIPKDAGDYIYTLYDYQTYDADGNLHTVKNYILTVKWDCGYLYIAPRDITVNSKDLPDYIFDDEEVNYPVYIDNHGELGGRGLPEGQSLKITSVEYYDEDGNLIDGVPTEVGTYYILPTSVVIYDEDDNIVDAERNYDVSYPEIEDCGTVTILPREIQLKTNSHDDWVYNGEYQYDAEFTLWLLNENGEPYKQLILTPEELAKVIIEPTKVKDVCENVDNVFECDFSATNYEITDWNWGTLTVKPRPIAVVTEGKTWTYDGDKHFWHAYEIANEILDSDGNSLHSFDVSFDKTITDKGSVQNTATVTAIYDEDGINVKSNYAIADGIYGYITIDPLEITVQSATNTDNWIYDGEEHYDEGFELTDGTLVDLHEITVTGNTKVRTVMQGETDNKLTYTIIDTDNDNRDVTTNYKITPVYGKLKINAVHITVKLIDGTVLTYGEGAYPEGEDNYDTSDSSALIDGEVLTVAVKYFKGETRFATPLGAGDYTVVIDAENSFVKTAYGENGMGNYIVDNDGDEVTLTVNPKAITVTLLTLQNKVYGEAFAGYRTGNDNYKSVDEGLEYDDKLQVFVLYSADIDEKTPVGEYSVNIYYCVIGGEYFYDLGAGENDCGNYLITFVGSKFNVTPRPLTVYSSGADKVYDGEELSCTEYKEAYYLDDYGRKKAGITEWDSEEEIIAYKEGTANSVINAGTTANQADFESLSENYTVVKVVPGNLTINKRAISITLEEIENEFYYGTPVAYNAGAGNFGYTKDTEYELVEIDGVSEELEIAVAFYTDAACTAKTEPKNADTYYYKFDLSGSTVYNSFGGAGVDNYEITCTDVKSFVIHRLAVTVELDGWSEEKIYNGSSYIYGCGYTVTDGGIDKKFAYNETLNLAVKYYQNGAELSGYPVNAGDYVVKYDKSASTIGGYAPDRNYDININPEDGISFTIGQKDITISMGDETRPYNGEAYDYATENTHFKAEGTVNGEEIIPVVSYADGTPKTVGPYTVVFDGFTVRYGNAEAGNYYVKNTEEVSCSVIITERELTITVYDRSIEIFDEIDPETDEDYDSSSNGAFGFYKEDLKHITPHYSYWLVKADGTETEFTAEEASGNLGSYEIRISFTDDNGVLENYNVVKTDYGTLEVTARKVTVKIKYTGEDLVYIGEEISLDGFGYDDWHTTDPTEEGFFEDSVPEHKFVFKKGLTTLTGAPVDAGTYEVRVEFTDVDETKYTIYNTDKIYITVNPRSIKVNLEYDKSQYQNLTYNYSLLPTSSVSITDTDITGEEKGILACDSAYEVKWYFYNYFLNDTVEYNYAGTCEIIFRLNKTNGNYHIVNEYSGETFTVAKAPLYITPVSETVKYAGEPLYLTKALIRYGELFGDDELVITGSDVLRTTRTLPVTIADATVWQNDGAYNVTSSYELHYTYEANDPFVGVKDWYARENFVATLSFIPIDIYYEQMVLDEEHSWFKYDGTLHDLGVTADTYGLITILNEEDILERNHTLQFMLMPIQMVRVYEKWVRISLFNGDTNITLLYNFVLVNGEESKVIVEGDRLDLSLNISETQLEEAWNNRNSEGNGVFTLSENYGANGYYVLGDGYYTVEGLTDSTHRCEVLVREENGEIVLKVVVFAISAYGDREEKSLTYTLFTDVNYSVTLSMMGLLLRPDTTNTQAVNAASIGGYNL